MKHVRVFASWYSVSVQGRALVADFDYQNAEHRRQAARAGGAVRLLYVLAPQDDAISQHKWLRLAFARARVSEASKHYDYPFTDVDANTYLLRHALAGTIAGSGASAATGQAPSRRPRGAGPPPEGGGLDSPVSLFRGRPGPHSVSAT